jgi:hypothetical protein
MQNVEYKLSEITQGCSMEDRSKYAHLIELHQDFMEELNHSHSFSDYLKDKGGDEDLIQFLSVIQEHGVQVAPAKSSICYAPSRGWVNIFA